MRKVGLIIIATGKYIKFVPDLINNAKSFFNLKNHLSIFLFTDQANIKSDFGRDVRTIEYNYIDWPLPTLMRYKGIVGASKYLERQDYLIYLDVDMKINSNCEDLFEKKIFGVRHPRHKISKVYPFETNKKSTAYIGDPLYSTYLCGGVQGGESVFFLNAAEEISKKIDADLSNNYIAKWHDESYWNKYAFENKIVSVFPSSYCWPEQWSVNDTPGNIIALKKDHVVLRNQINFILRLKFFLSDLRLKLLRPKSY